MYADKYAKNLSLNWQRTKTAVVLGGIDNDKLYLHMANQIWGMSATGKNTSKITEFNFMTSFIFIKNRTACNEQLELFITIT